MASRWAVHWDNEEFWIQQHRKEHRQHKGTILIANEINRKAWPPFHSQQSLLMCLFDVRVRILLSASAVMTTPSYHDSHHASPSRDDYVWHKSSAVISQHNIVGPVFAQKQRKRWSLTTNFVQDHSVLNAMSGKRNGCVVIFLIVQEVFANLNFNIFN